MTLIILPTLPDTSVAGLQDAVAGHTFFICDKPDYFIYTDCGDNDYFRFESLSLLSLAHLLKANGFQYEDAPYSEKLGVVYFKYRKGFHTVGVYQMKLGVRMLIHRSLISVYPHELFAIP
jgi:hypothetical protein